jgi:hypothetical protein
LVFIAIKINTILNWYEKHVEIPCQELWENRKQQSRTQGQDTLTPSNGTDRPMSNAKESRLYPDLRSIIKATFSMKRRAGTVLSSSSMSDAERGYVEDENGESK